MSEYQYYEFLAIDRQLTQEEMDELRDLSTRAEITSSSFTNVYHWGDFKGKPYEFVKKYFDAFVYVANWGTRELMLRVPRSGVDENAILEYGLDEALDISTAGGDLIVAFSCEEADGEGWVEGSGWMSRLVGLRQDVLRGDLRCLYFGWLGGIYGPDIDEDSVEPPVPPGLKDLSGPLDALGEFLDISPDLIAAAGETSAPVPEAADDVAGLPEWLRNLPASEKDDLLTAFMRDSRPELRWELLRRFREATRPAEATSHPPRRTAGQLIARADQLRDARQRAEAEHRAAEDARRQREEAEARRRRLDTLVGREEQLWLHVERLIQAKQPKLYDQAVVVIRDLRDLAEREGTSGDHAAHLFSLRERHHRKTSLLRRLDQAGLA